MSLQFAHGAVQWNAADAAATTYPVTGLGFAPKALRFYWFGLGSGTDTASQTTHMRKGVGFAVSASNRACMGAQSQDAAGSQVCTTGYRNDAIAVTVTNTPAVDGLLDLQSVDADGFTLVVDDQAPADLSVFWEAWGGAGVLEANLIEITEPASTGNVAYVCGFRPAALLFAGVQGTAAANTVTRNDCALMVGAATGIAASQQWVAVGNDDDGSATSDTDGYARGGECLAAITVAGGNPNARASLAAVGDSGFTLNWAARGTTDRRYLALCMAGGQFRAGSYTIEGNSLNATAEVSGLPFQPRGLSLAGMMRAESASATSSAEDRMALGSASSTTSRRSQGGWSENGNATAAEIDLVIEYDQVLAFPSNAGALLAAYDVDAILPDGFRIIVDVAGGVASEWHGYLACGGKAPVTFNNYLAARAGNGMSVAERIR